MAVLTKDEYFNALNERMKNSTSDDDIAFLENMTDTYTDLENRLNNNGENWEQKYHDLDESWRRRYSHRFFGGSSGNPNERKDDKDCEEKAEEIIIEDLFKED